MIPFVLSTVAFAEPTTPPATPPATVPKFEELDLDKDLALDKTEVTKHEVLTREFTTLDTDKNGKLSKDEFAAWADKAEKR